MIQQHTTTNPLLQRVPLLWLDVVVTSEFERDTLPLLFSGDRLFDDYYVALQHKHTAIAPMLREIYDRNLMAREQRSQGYWQECLTSLHHCVHLRKSLFPETDFQYIASVRHYISACITVGSFFLRECSELKVEAAVESVAGTEKKKSDEDVRGMLSRAFTIFSRAEQALPLLTSAAERDFFTMILTHNFANYYMRRKKYNAAGQYVYRSLTAQTRAGSKLASHVLLFEVRKASADAYNGRHQLAATRLLDIISRLPRPHNNVNNRAQDGGAADVQTAFQNGKSDQNNNNNNNEVSFDEDPETYELVDDDPHRANSGGPGTPTLLLPISLQTLGNNTAVPIRELTYLCAFHTLAVCLVSLRRYKEAAMWCTRSMEVAASNGAFFPPSHSHVIAIRRLQNACDQMLHEPTLATYRIPKSQLVSPEISIIRRAIKSARAPPMFQTILERQRETLRQRRIEAEAQQRRDAEEVLRNLNKATKPPTVKKPGAYRRAEPTLADRISSLMPNLTHRRLRNEFGNVITKVEEESAAIETSRKEQQQQQQQVVVARQLPPGKIRPSTAPSNRRAPGAAAMGSNERISLKSRRPHKPQAHEEEEEDLADIKLDLGEVATMATNSPVKEHNSHTELQDVELDLGVQVEGENVEQADIDNDEFEADEPNPSETRCDVKQNNTGGDDDDEFAQEGEDKKSTLNDQHQDNTFQSFAPTEQPSAIHDGQATTDSNNVKESDENNAPNNDSNTEEGNTFQSFAATEEGTRDKPSAIEDSTFSEVSGLKQRECDDVTAQNDTPANNNNDQQEELVIEPSADCDDNCDRDATPTITTTTTADDQKAKEEQVSGTGRPDDSTFSEFSVLKHDRDDDNGIDDKRVSQPADDQKVKEEEVARPDDSTFSEVSAIKHDVDAKAQNDDQQNPSNKPSAAADDSITFSEAHSVDGTGGGNDASLFSDVGSLLSTHLRHVEEAGGGCGNNRSAAAGGPNHLQESVLVSDSHLSAPNSARHPAGGSVRSSVTFSEVGETAAVAKSSRHVRAGSAISDFSDVSLDDNHEQKEKEEYNEPNDDHHKPVLDADNASYADEFEDDFEDFEDDDE
eukprot:PhM_4_TR14120/c0_g1_i1/m.22584